MISSHDFSPACGDNAQSATDVGSVPYDMLPRVSPEVVSEDQLGEVRFGRSRMLKRIGAAIFGVSVMGVMTSSRALAHGTCAHSTIAMCGPSKRCCCCNANGCCVGGCTTRCCECPNGGWAWNQDYNGCSYACTDWWQPHEPPHDRCICQILRFCY